MDMIEYRNVGMKYGDKTIISQFNLTVQKREFVTIIGSSGCGKTTVLKMVNGLIIPTTGDVFVHGINTKEENIIELRRRIGYAIQGSVLFPHMTVEKNIAYVPSLLNKKNKKKTDEAVDKWMKIVGLDESMKKSYPNQLSGGQQQRVGIARALAASPDILLMDEPFGAVDEITRGMLQDEILRIFRETDITVLFVTHDIQEAMKLGTKMLVMNGGMVQQYDTPEVIKKNPANAFVQSLLQRYREDGTSTPPNNFPNLGNPA